MPYLKTSYNLNKKRPNIRKGVEGIMGGKVLETKTGKAIHEGIDKTSYVLKKLLNEGRTDDFNRALDDKEYLYSLISNMDNK